MQNIIVDDNNFESVLGTPTAQKVIKLLVSWSSLSVQDLVIKSNYSKSQVHSTLKKLVAYNIIHSPSRGIYAFQDTPFSNLLKEAYMVKILELINSQIYHIKQLLKKNQLDEAEKKFSELIKQYHPVLQESFSSQLSSLSLRFIEILREME
jgi:DNA-binding transcriptional regulator GbsR (MarR family)